MSSTSFTFKIQICDIYSTIICPLYFTYNFEIYVPYSFFFVMVSLSILSVVNFNLRYNFRNPRRLHIWPAYSIKVVFANTTKCRWLHDIGSDGGRVVKLLACGARGPGFKSRPRHLNFRDCYLLLLSRNMAEIPLTRRKSSIQPTNFMTLTMTIMLK